MDKILSTVGGIMSATVLPALGGVGMAICPTVTETIKNITRDFDQKKGKPMVYPYTYTAKVVQFPYYYYWKNGWVLKHYLWAFVVLIPLFHKFSNIVNTPENKKQWRKIREEWYGPHGHH